MDQLVTTVREKQWLAMLGEQKESGLTIKDWCRENGISENSFYYRQNKLRKRIGSALPTFVELKPHILFQEVHFLHHHQILLPSEKMKTNSLLAMWL